MNNKRRIISFSLYGDHPKYQRGALDNLRLARELYPGWTCRFHVSQEISPSIVCKLKGEGGEVIIKSKKEDTDQRSQHKRKDLDQTFLSQMVYPRIKDDVLIHSEFVCFEGEQVQPFPSPRRDFVFVGEILNADGTRIERHFSALRKQGMKVYPMPDERLIARFKNKLHRLKRRISGCA